MPCCGGAGCACKIEGGVGIEVSGSGSASDPVVIDANVNIEEKDNAQFNTIVVGDGSLSNPYQLETAYATTHKLNDLPDVVTPTPTNGQVLGWDNATQKWTNRAPTTAAAGSVTTGDGIQGDGSAGAPLVAQTDTARLVGILADLIGLTDEGMNAVVRKFSDEAARSAATPAPTVNSISAINGKPGEFSFFDGSFWQPWAGADQIGSGELLNLSGPYSQGMRLTHLLMQVDTVTDVNGVFDVIPASLLATATKPGGSPPAGVVSVQFQETGTLAWRGVVFGDTDRVAGTAFRLLDGSPYASQAVTGTVDAWLY